MYLNECGNCMCPLQSGLPAQRKTASDPYIILFSDQQKHFPQRWKLLSVKLIAEIFNAASIQVDKLTSL
jgi:hypothetical protein